MIVGAKEDLEWPEMMKREYLILSFVSQAGLYVVPFFWVDGLMLCRTVRTQEKPHGTPEYANSAEDVEQTWPAPRASGYPTADDQGYDRSKWTT